MKKVEKKYGIRFSTKKSKNSTAPKTTTLWYERKEDRDRDLRMFNSNANYRNVREVNK